MPLFQNQLKGQVLLMSAKYRIGPKDSVDPVTGKRLDVINIAEEDLDHPDVVAFKNSKKIVPFDGEMYPKGKIEPKEKAPVESASTLKEKLEKHKAGEGLSAVEKVENPPEGEKSPEPVPDLTAGVTGQPMMPQEKEAEEKPEEKPQEAQRAPAPEPEPEPVPKPQPAVSVKSPPPEEENLEVKIEEQDEEKPELESEEEVKDVDNN